MSAKLCRLAQVHQGTPCRLEVDGAYIPYIEVFEYEDRAYSILIERPGFSPLLGMDVESEEELLRWAPFLANAMAVAAGRTSHGPNSRPLNPHGANWFFDEVIPAEGRDAAEAQS